MLRPSTRAAAVTGALALGLSLLSACGSDEAPSQPGKGLDSVTIEGKFGAEPTVTFHGLLDPDKAETKVLIEGDGDTVEDGDTVSANWWAASGYQLPPDEDAKPEDSESEDAEPQDEKSEDGESKDGKSEDGEPTDAEPEEEPVAEPTLDADGGYVVQPGQSTFATGAQPVELTKDIIAPLREALIGRKVGSRVAVLSSAEDAFGEAGNAAMGVGNKDAVLFVVDVVDTKETAEILDGPQGEDREPASWAPEIIEKDGVPTGFDFSTGHKPSGKLIATTLLKGDGPVVKKGQTIDVNYLGQVYQGKKPFDESYSKGKPADFVIGVGEVVKGWDERLVGRTVGSRVIIEIPPSAGYGKAGQPDVGIKGTDTLFFVVDILRAT